MLATCWYNKHKAMDGLATVSGIMLGQLHLRQLVKSSWIPRVFAVEPAEQTKAEKKCLASNEFGS